jgi:hypothetical protein
MNKMQKQVKDLKLFKVGTGLKVTSSHISYCALVENGNLELSPGRLSFAMLYIFQKEGTFFKLRHKSRELRPESRQLKHKCRELRHKSRELRHQSRELSHKSRESRHKTC